MAFEKSTEACCGNGSDENENWSDINTDDDDNGLSYFDK